MEDRLAFVIGQKKRLLNEIVSRMANFKANGKNLGVQFTLLDDGSLQAPKNFENEIMPIQRAEYNRLTKAEKKVYDEHFCQSTAYLIQAYNEANDKYNAIFEQLDVHDKIDVLNREVKELSIDEARANAYLASLSKRSAESRLNQLDPNVQLSDEQVLEINEEITQINYIKTALKTKDKQLKLLIASL